MRTYHQLNVMCSAKRPALLGQMIKRVRLDFKPEKYFCRLKEVSRHKTCHQQNDYASSKG